MSVQARINHLFGGSQTPVTVTLTNAATVLPIPDTGSWIEVTATGGTTTFATFTIPSWSRNRMVILYNAGTSNLVFTTNDNSTTAGQFDLGVNNVMLGTGDIMILYVRGNGVAVRINSIIN